MTRSEPATTVGDPQKTEVGSVFVSNYPPYSAWVQGELAPFREALAREDRRAEELGLYLHIPFCRKRCKFCYFRVYTDKNARQVEDYLDAVVREAELYAAQSLLDGRALKFVYFGGGTPSFISARHLRSLVERLRAVLPWGEPEEVTFECEPGTLTEAKLEVIREIGVTRLSLGVENFDDAILRENGRAHVSKEIERVLPWIERLDFDQLNIDLIAGMIGETDATWERSVGRAIEASPDSVTIYQLELPYNTIYSKSLLHEGQNLPVADWETKRRWHDEAFRRFEEAGYSVSSAYTAVRGPAKFVYRNSVWRGCDLLGLGVSSFSHLGGVHAQNSASWDTYLSKIAAGEFPTMRAYEPTAEQRLIRELILQLKLGRLDAGYFREKFGEEIGERFGAQFDELERRGMLERDGDRFELTREALLRVDGLLPAFYEDRYRGTRYT